MIRPVLAVALLGLAACDRGEEGTAISINADGGNVMGEVSKSGELKVDVPGFEGSIKLPRIKLDASNLDLNGAKLYPGTTVENISIAGSDGGPGEGVRVSFTSPAAVATVRDWLDAQLNRAGYRVEASGQGLAGTTDEGKPFRLDLAPDGGDKAKGTIVIG